LSGDHRDAVLAVCPCRLLSKVYICLPYGYERDSCFYRAQDEQHKAAFSGNTAVSILHTNLTFYVCFAIVIAATPWNPPP